MGEFFHGRRRMFGVVTLVMASLFMGTWLRSLSIIDLVTIRTLFGYSYSFESHDGELTWLYWKEDHQTRKGIYWISHPQPLMGRRVFEKSFNFRSPIRFTKIEIMYVPTATAKAKGVVTSAWVIVLPLTVISLLLFKPSKSSQMKISEKVVFRG